MAGNQFVNLSENTHLIIGNIFLQFTWASRSCLRLYVIATSVLTW